MPEEKRAIGYICPECGKPVYGERTLFALSAAAAGLVCACGRSELTAEPCGERYRVTVPCGVCGGEHRAEVPADRILRGTGVGLACPQSRQLCCYIGDVYRVRQALGELEAALEKKDGGGTFTDDTIMYEVLSELKDIASRPGGITCGCGSSRYGMEIRRSAVDLICRDCGAKLRVPAATDRDLDDLCCHMKLVLPGKK